MSPERALNQTAAVLSQAASTTRAGVRHGSRFAVHAADHLADGLDATAAYVRAPLDPARRLLDRYPARCLGAAAGLGFLTGVWLWRKTGRAARTPETTL